MHRITWFFLGACTCVLTTPVRAESPIRPIHPTTQRSSDDESQTLDELTTAELLALEDTGEIIYIEDERPSEPSAASERDVYQAAIAITPRRSADDLLRLVPGLYISQHASEGKAQQIFLRGFDAVHGSDVSVHVAGVPVNELSNVHGHGYVDVGFVIPELVLSLSARKGSAALSQGNFATAGSVAFDLGVARELRGHRVRYEAGSTNRHRVLGVIAPEHEPEANFLAIEAMRDDGFGQNRGAERVTAMAQRRFSLAGDARFVELFGAAYGARFGEPGTIPASDMARGMLDFYGSYDPDSDGLSMRGLGGARFHDEGAHHRLDARAHLQWRRFDIEENFTGFLLYQDEGDKRRQQHTSLSAGGRARVERDLGDRFVAILGSEFLADAIDQADDQVLSDGTPWLANRALGATQLTGAAYAGLRGKLGSLVFEGGARVDAMRIAATDQLTGMTGSDTLMVASPRLNASYQVDERVRLFGGYGRGLRSPEARAMVTPVLADGMDESLRTTLQADITTTDSFELGARARINDRISVGGAGFGILIANEMVFDHATGINLARNATRRLGVELDVEATPLPWLTLRGDVSAVDARFTDSGSPVPGAPRLLGSLEARVGHASGLRGGAQFTYMAPRPLANGATGGTVAVLNLIGGYRLGRFDIDVQIDNALGSRWREAEFHYASWFDRSQPRSDVPRLHYSPGRPLGVRAALSTWF